MVGGFFPAGTPKTGTPLPENSVVIVGVTGQSNVLAVLSFLSDMPPVTQERLQSVEGHAFIWSRVKSEFAIDPDTVNLGTPVAPETAVDQWRPLTTGYGFSGPKPWETPSNAVGCFQTLAYWLYQFYGRPVYVLAVGRGATSLNIQDADTYDFHPSSPPKNSGAARMFDVWKDRFREDSLAALRTKIGPTAGIYHAGEVFIHGTGDMKTAVDAGNYEASLLALIDAMRLETPNVPMVITQGPDYFADDGTFTSGNDFCAEVRTAQANAVAARPDCEMVSLDSFPRSDGVHFNGDGQNKIGTQAAWALMAMDKAVLAVDGPTGDNTVGSAGDAVVVGNNGGGDPLLPDVSFVNEFHSVQEDGIGVQVSAMLSEPSLNEVRVPLEVGGDAVYGTDYTLRYGPLPTDGELSPRVLVFAAGETAASVYVVPIDDAIHEGSLQARIFMLEENSNGDQLVEANIVAPLLSTATIQDDEPEVGDSGPPDGSGDDDPPEFPAIYDETNTGPIVALEDWTGSNTLVGPVVITGKKFIGQVTFAGPGVELYDCEVDANGASYGIHHQGLTNTGAVVQRCFIHNAKTACYMREGLVELNRIEDWVDAFKADGTEGNKLTVRNNYITKGGRISLAANPDNPPHADSIQIVQRTADFLFEGNNVVMYGLDPLLYAPTTCAIIQTANGPVTGEIIFRENWLGVDGPYTLNLTDKGNGFGAPTNVTLDGNVFWPFFTSGPLNSDMAAGDLVVTGNIDPDGVNRDSEILAGQAW